MSYFFKTKKNDTTCHQYSCYPCYKKTQKLQQQMHCCKINKKQKRQVATIVGGKVVVAPCHQM
jgi:hypothetical protein